MRVARMLYPGYTAYTDGIFGVCDPVLVYAGENLRIIRLAQCMHVGMWSRVDRK